MAADPSRVLLVDDDPDALTVIARALEREGYVVDRAPSGAVALERAAANPPDIVLSDYYMPGVNGLELLQRFRENATLASAAFVIVTAASEHELMARGLQAGVDDYLTKPVEHSELIARVRALLDRRRLRIQLEHSFAELLDVLVDVMDLHLPGAARRGEELAATARLVAGRFGIPDALTGDLELAARLHEIGKLPAPAQAGGERDERHYVIASHTILTRIPRLRGAAEIVESVEENWDGTGFPSRLERGQIPLRSRILRVLIDVVARTHQAEAAGHRSDPEATLGAIEAHAGTWYDPAVLSEVAHVLVTTPSDQWLARKRLVPVGQLVSGMVLAEDLHASSGTKLLTGGTRLDHHLIELIQRRNVYDPIRQGVWVSR